MYIYTFKEPPDNMNDRTNDGGNFGKIIISAGLGRYLSILVYSTDSLYRGIYGIYSATDWHAPGGYFRNAAGAALAVGHVTVLASFLPHHTARQTRRAAASGASDLGDGCEEGCTSSDACVCFGVGLLPRAYTVHGLAQAHRGHLVEFFVRYF